MTGRVAAQTMGRGNRGHARPATARMCDKTHRDTSLEIRLALGVKTALERAAEADLRSVSGLTEKILAGWLRKNGHMAEE